MLPSIARYSVLPGIAARVLASDASPLGARCPDVPAPLTFAAYRELRDPAMEAVMAREKH